MMNRRSFLKNFALGAAGLYVPKIIFDMGANKHKYIIPLEDYTFMDNIKGVFLPPNWGEVILHGKKPFDWGEAVGVFDAIPKFNPDYPTRPYVIKCT